MPRKLTQLRKIRRLRDLTQTELSERSGVSLYTIHKAESGVNSPRLDTLEALARALQVDVQDLVAPPGYVNRSDGDITLMRELEPAQ